MFDNYTFMHAHADKHRWMLV